MEVSQREECKARSDCFRLLDIWSSFDSEVRRMTCDEMPSAEVLARLEQQRCIKLIINLQQSSFCVSFVNRKCCVKRGPGFEKQSTGLAFHSFDATGLTDR